MQTYMSIYYIDGRDHVTYLARLLPLEAAAEVKRLGEAGLDAYAVTDFAALPAEWRGRYREQLDARRQLLQCDHPALEYGTVYADGRREARCMTCGSYRYVSTDAVYEWRSRDGELIRYEV